LLYPPDKLSILTEYYIFFSLQKLYHQFFFSLKNKEIYLPTVGHRISVGSKSRDCICFVFEISLDECLDRILLKLATWNLEVVPNLSVVSFLYRIMPIWVSLGKVVSDLFLNHFSKLGTTYSYARMSCCLFHLNWY
jgi:hypothetical protein